MKKKLISMLAVCSIACCVGAGVSVVKANAEDYSDKIVSIIPLDGASVRVDTESEYYNGIRFQATVDADVYDALEKSETETRTVDYGMIVAPLDYETAEGKGAFTKENLFGESRVYYIDGVTEAGENLTKLGGGYVANLSEYQEDATKMVLSGSLLNIANSQLTREFVGVPYICITDNGVKEYHVASYKDSRSMVYVAQRAIENAEASGLTEAQIKHLSDNYVNYKDDTTDVASKQYSYTVEHIALDPEGNQVEVLATTYGEKTTLGTTVSATANEYKNYTYDESRSTVSGIIYANNRTTLKLYYVQNHVNVLLANTQGCTIAPDDEKYVGKNYALIEDGMYHFTVTPSADYDKHTQIFYTFVNGNLWVPKDAGMEGKYAVDLSGYQNGKTIELGVAVGEFKPTLEAGKGNYINKVSITKENEKDNSVLYTYKNNTSGLDQGTDSNWGESGLFFDEVYNTRINATAQQNKFFNKGYKYIRFDMKFADNVTGYNIRVENFTYQMEFSANYDKKSSIVKVANAANVSIDKVEHGTWYTFYVQPTKGKPWMLWADGGSPENPSITYIKNVQYLEELPKNEANLVMRISGELPERNASLEYKVDGDFAGAYKYTNNTLGTSGGVWGEAGIYFNEVYNANLGYTESQTFFKDGYQYIKLDFYAESSVYSISLQNAFTVGSTYQHLVADKKLPEGTIFAVYDKDGNKVDKWVAGAWYTLVIKPTENNVMRIQTNANKDNPEVPVMYIKNVSYCATNPFAN